MKTARAAGLILLGVVVGALSAGLSSPVEAQARQRLTRSDDLTVIRSDGRTGLGQFSFVKDTKSGGCWIYATETVGSGESAHFAITLAVAPASACD